MTTTNDPTALTDFEFRYLDLIAYDEMTAVNGGEPETYSDVHVYNWSDERAADLGISEQALGGIMSSLIQKGLIVVNEPDNRYDSTVSMTRVGFAAWRKSKIRRSIAKSF
jgi:hypothetical protein